jgi:nitrogenase-stabilizing/protective protein
VTTPDRALACLADCRDAEDYFALLEVDYDRRVLEVNRLHILTLFAQHLQLAEEPDPADDGQQPRATQRAALERAYQALVTGTALDHRLFKVLRERAPGQFVPLQDVSLDDVSTLGGSR